MPNPIETAGKVDSRSWLCACPDCQAPLSVRWWLMLADCWQCGTSIAIEAWPESSGAGPIAAASLGSSAGTSADRATVARPRPMSPRAPSTPQRTPSAPRRHEAVPIVPATTTPHVPPRRGVPADLPVAPPVRRRERITHRSLLDVPAWLASLLFHLLLLLVLAWLTQSAESDARRIVLSVTVGKQHQPGGRVELPMNDDEPVFDLPLPELWETEDPQQRAILVAADQDARELRVDAPPSNLDLPELRRAIQADGPQRLFATRDPRVRVELVRQEGGTTLTEAAVARGLRWLARHQARDGRWSLHRFADHADCQGRCNGEAALASDTAATSLALLPFLGAGQTHQSGIYRDVVGQGLAWLIEQQAADGDLRGDSRGQPGMYAQGQAAIVLSEAYAMTRDPRLRRPAQRAIDFIVNAQHPGGGWRYHPGERGDTSVLGWQLMALQSARVGGLFVPLATLDAATAYLDRAQADDRITYAYQPGTPPTCVMTAEALLCRLYLGWTGTDPRVVEGLSWLATDHPPDVHQPDIYYWYYATQSLHHAGGPAWHRWNESMRQILVELQETQGHEAGSWSPRGPHSEAGGRIYMTTLAICSLEVYYRHAPIFRPLASN